MNKPGPERVPTTAWSSLEPYTQLLRALLPRMNSLSVFDARGHMHWSSDAAMPPEVSGLVVEAAKEAVRERGLAGIQRMAGNDPFYLFWLNSDDAAADAPPFAVVVIGFRHSSDSEQRTVAALFAQ